MKPRWLLLFLVLFANPVAARDVVIRTSTVPEQPIWVGQKVSLHIDVLTSEGWVQARFPEIEVDGAYVLSKESQGTRLNEAIDGTSYSGQRYEVLVFPQRGGTLTIPAIPLRLEIKIFGVEAETEARAAATEPLELKVAVPPGAAGVRGLISTSALDAAQTWQPSGERLRVGDAIRRTVTLVADDVSGMAFTPQEPAALPGVSVYSSQPTVDDRYDRGELRGRRVETVTYVFERDGAVHLPARRISWWNLERQVMETAALPGLDLEIAALPLASRAGADAVAVGLLTVLAVLLPATVVWWRWARVRQVYARWRERRETSEAAYFRRFEQEAKSGDAKATLAALMIWLDRTQEPPALVGRFVAEFGDAEALHEIERLLRSASGDGADGFDAEALRRALVAARRRWRDRRGSGGRRVDLPELNPVR